MKHHLQISLLLAAFIGYLSIALASPLERGINDTFIRVAASHTPDTRGISFMQNAVIKARNRYDSSHRTPTEGHVIYAAVGFISMIMVSSMLATRIRILTSGITNFRATNLIRVLTLLIYIVAMCFTISAGILISGWDFVTEGLCRTAIDLCLVFYVGDKVILYLFLVERTHQIRGPSCARYQDPTFFLSVVIVLGGFGIIAVFAFLYPVTSLSNIDGKCRIGLPFKVTLPLLVYDILINLGLTAFFCVIGHQYLRGRTFKQMMTVFSAALPFHHSKKLDTQENLLMFMMIKGTLGALAIIMPTVANLAILFKLNGHEQGWLCFTVCTIDITWSTIIIHWLTSTPPDLENHPRIHTSSSYYSSSTISRVPPSRQGQYVEMM